MKPFKSQTVIFCITFFLAFFSTQADVFSVPQGDYTLHTLYIFNFTKYVEWPSGNKSIKIGVLNSSSAESFLSKMAKTKSAAGAELSVVNTKNEDELGTCQIVFIPSDNTSHAAKLIERFNAQPILIITEEPDLTKKGASVSFKEVAGKLRFQLNEESIKTKGLKVAASLINLAER